MTGTKKTTKRTYKRRAGNSPSPSRRKVVMPACGHSSCEPNRCKVQHIGPTSRMYDHHILHAARGITHTWVAVIVAGLALLITGTFLFINVNAQDKVDYSLVTNNSTNVILQRLDKLENKMTSMQNDIDNINKQINLTKPGVKIKDVFPNN